MTFSSFQSRLPLIVFVHIDVSESNLRRRLFVLIDNAIISSLLFIGATLGFKCFSGENGSSRMMILGNRQKTEVKNCRQKPAICMRGHASPLL
jgi:hypothetical protein